MPDAATETALRSALQKAGYALAHDAPYLVDYSVAERSARTGISSKPGGEWLSEEEPKQPLFSCKQKTHRITFTITERATGAALYTGSAEEHHCRATLAESRDALIKAILSDVPQPAGKRVLRRAGRN